MKKRILMVMVAVLGIFLVTACGSQKEETAKGEVKQEQKQEVKAEKAVKIAALKGPTTMGLVKLFSDNEAGKALNKYETSIANTPDEIVAAIGKGEFDMAAIPANLASVIYNKTQGKVQVAAVNTLSVLYMVETGNSVKSVKDLKGKTVYTTNKGATPEFVLNYILKGNGLEPGKDVKIEFKSEAAEVAALLSKESNVVAMLPEPFVTVAQTKNKNLKTAFYMGDEWDKVPGTKAGSQITGVLVVNKKFAEENPEAVKNFLKEYKESIEFLSSNVEEGAKLVAKYNIVPEPVAKLAIPKTRTAFIAGSEMKEKMEDYLKILFGESPESVGGKLPAEDFYLIVN